MSNADNLSLNYFMARIPTTYKHAIKLVVIARKITTVERYGKVEVYTAQTDDAPEMFLGYAQDLGDIGVFAKETLHMALYVNGFKPKFECD